MSMCDYPIKLFGVSSDEISIKPEYWLPWKEAEKLPPDKQPKYEDFGDFVDCEISDASIGYETNDDYCYVGFVAGQPWQMTETERSFKSEKDAAKYLAHALAPYCGRPEEEIEAACGFIEDTYCG